MSSILMLTEEETLFNATVVIAGIVIVVGVLLLLILIFRFFGKIVPMIERKTKATEEKSAARKAARKAAKAAKKAEKNGEKVTPAPADASVRRESIPALSPAPVAEPGISGEIVAAISAAIAATEGSGAVVRSIKKKKVSGRNPWSAAAAADNTRPF